MTEKLPPPAGPPLNSTLSSPRKGGYLEALLTSCPAAILAINAEGIITFANKAACKLVDRAICDLVGENIVTVYGDLDAARETNRQLYLNGGVIRDYQSKVKTKSGKVINVRISATHMKDSQGNYIGAVGFFEHYRPWPAAEVQLKVHLEEMEAKLATSRGSGSPVFEIYPEISAVVISGPLDVSQFQQITDSLLDHVKECRSRVAMIDLSGAQVEDTVANQLVKAIRTMHLLGVQCVLAGCKPSIAKAMEPLITEVSTIKSFCSPQLALQAALNLIGYEITRKR